MATNQSLGNYRDSGEFIIPETPLVLTIAGSDSSAGAGIQADIKTFSSLGVYGLTAVTAVVAETSREVRLIEPVSTAMLESQLDLLLATYPIAAIKTGMLPNEEHIQVIAHALEAWKARTPSGKLIVDPIIRSSTGVALISTTAEQALQSRLLPIATLMTPNLPEARALSEDSVSQEDLGPALMERYGINVLMKGGHADDEAWAIDILHTPTGTTRFEAERLPGGHQLHGTGCTLSAAIAAHLAKGMALEDAIAESKAYLTTAIGQAHVWESDLQALRHSPASL